MRTKPIPTLTIFCLLSFLASGFAADEKAKIFDFGENPGANAREDVKVEKKSVSSSKSTKSSTSTTNINGKATTVTRNTGEDGKETVVVTMTEPGKEPKVEIYSGEEYDKKNGAGKPKFDAKSAPAEMFDRLLNDPNLPETAKEMLRKMRKDSGVSDAQDDADGKKDSEDPSGENPSNQPAADKKTKSKKATE